MYIAADVNASWKKKYSIHCICLYSMDMAFKQQKHDKYSSQTKGPKPMDKGIFERHEKLQADPWHIHDSIKISIS